MNRHFRSSVLVAALCTIGASTSAQVSFGGHPLGLDRTNALPEAPVAVMPAVDAVAMKAEDAELAKEGKARPYRFGYNHVVDLGLDNSGVWHQLPNGDRVWRLAIHCPEAYSINFEFHDYVVPEGAQVFVYNSAQEVLGAFEEGSNPGHTSLGVTMLAGDGITIEYVEPIAVRGQGLLRIGQVTHAYRDVLKSGDALGESGSCNNNVICPVGDPWREQIRSVAIIIVAGNGYCTGQLINNCADDGTPYFLTADHCVDGASPNNWIFRFGWESPNCVSNLNGPTNKTVAGSTLKVASAGSDMALLQLNQTPPASYNVFYTGWDKSTMPATNATAIHHPSGDVKKISFENQAVTSGVYNGAQCWKVSAWDDGTTEQGSSGSGLWNQNKLLVGQLYGGQASCQFNFNDYYGKFSTSYPLLEQWLGTCGNTHDGFPTSTVGIDESELGQLLQFAPNPSTGIVTVSVPEGLQGNTRIEVLDALGKLVMQESVAVSGQQVMLDLSGKPIGLYTLRATTSRGRFVGRLVLTR